MAFAQQQVLDDIRFAEDNWGEFGGLCPLMRYVVALNEEMTLREWLEVAAARGWNPVTARRQFNESRKVSAEMDNG